MVICTYYYRYCLHIIRLHLFLVSNFYFAGDWIDRGGHKSWSQEKSLVTGYQAGRAVLTNLFGFRVANLAPKVIEVTPPEPHVYLGRSFVSRIRNNLLRSGVKSWRL